MRINRAVGNFFVLCAVVNCAEILTAQEQKSRPGGLSPAEAFKQFTVPDDLELEQVLAEPVVRQPVFLKFDERD